MNLGRPKLTLNSLSSINADFSQHPTATSVPINEKKIKQIKSIQIKITSIVILMPGLWKLKNRFRSLRFYGLNN